MCFFSLACMKSFFFRSPLSRIHLETSFVPLVSAAPNLLILFLSSLVLLIWGFTVSSCRFQQAQKVTLSRAQGILMGQTVSDENDTLHRITKNLGTRMEQVKETAVKIRRLRSALESASEAFSAAERRNARMGSDMLYQDVIRNTAAGQGQPYYAVFHGGISNGQIVPEWLRELARETGNA